MKILQVHLDIWMTPFSFCIQVSRWERTPCYSIWMFHFYQTQKTTLHCLLEPPWPSLEIFIWQIWPLCSSSQVAFCLFFNTLSECSCFIFHFLMQNVKHHSKLKVLSVQCSDINFLINKLKCIRILFKPLSLCLPVCLLSVDLFNYPSIDLNLSYLSWPLNKTLPHVAHFNLWNKLIIWSVTWLL